MSASIRGQLPPLLRELGARSLLDVGCGDMKWMRMVDLGVDYIGVDVVPDLIEENRRLYRNRQFLVADATKDRLPSADVVLCRQCLIHLSNRQVGMVLRNLKNTRAKYLLATTFPAITNNADIWSGSFRPINLELQPFNLPKPLHVLYDSKPTDQSSVLSLWRFTDIAI
jgi:SAM-dependent methyltransferase